MSSSAFFLIICSLQLLLVRTDFDQDLYRLTEEVISEYFIKFPCITYITNNIYTEVQLTDKRPVYVVYFSENSEPLLIESFEQGCGGYVIRVDNTTKSTLVQHLIYAKHKAIGSRYSNQRYLFLPTDQSDLSTDLLVDPNMYYMPNIIIVTPNGNDLKILSHTLLDHHTHNVLGINKETIDIWSPTEGFKYQKNIYPDRTRNVKGRKFVLGAVNYSPFSVIWEEDNKTIFDGYETRIAAEFVKVVNGTWDGLDHPEELWGEVYPNGSGSGVVGSVIARRADFGYSAFYQWFCEDVDCSYPFYQSAVTCLVPKPLLVSGWLTIILPLASDTWLALIFFYVVNTIFVLFVLLSLRHIKGLKICQNMGMTVSDSLFTVFRLQLEQIPVIPKTKNPLAVYIKISVYYYFFVAAFWQGGIASILTVPRYEKPINEVSDLLERWPKLKWGANSDAWVNSIKASSDPSLVQIVHKFVILDDETLHRKSMSGDFGLFIERLPHGHYGYNDYINEESMNYLRLMEGSIYSAFGVIILPKGSPFSERFDRVVLQMFDTGLVHKIEVQISLDRINNRLQNMIRHSNEKKTSSVILAVRHIQGPLYIYIVGMTFASVVFLVEKLIKTRK